MKIINWRGVQRTNVIHKLDRVRFKGTMTKWTFNSTHIALFIDTEIPQYEDPVEFVNSQLYTAMLQEFVFNAVRTLHGWLFIRYIISDFRLESFYRFILMNEKALRKHSLHRKVAVSVLLKLFISSNKICHTTDAP